ncbi:MAG: AAA family ATPase [Deltaproteobacteria bacterium]|nr:AAA family ATPase [Deltaproteobacteria bacterium]
MSEEISEAARALIKQEAEILGEVVTSLKEQREHYFERSAIESKRARELTSKIVAARRDEDKAMLASDEAVSHALEQRNRQTLKALEKQIKRPYFGRILLEENAANGSTRQIEYKIGFSANPDCRIIDWRKAPISKLFYEYKEGEEYSEEIQGVERNGKVTLRNTFEIENSALKRISCRLGTFEKRGDDWAKIGGLSPVLEPSSAGRMPEVLALITAEQFQSITSEAKSAVLIQGVAGSGKTTVALHRLAWLLDPDNAGLDAAQCIVIVLTNSLKQYIINTLPQLGLEEVRVKTFSEWSLENIKRILPQYIDENGAIRRPASPTPTSIDRLKRSMAILNTLDERFKRDKLGLGDLVCKLLDDPAELIRNDETKLIDRSLVEAARARSLQNQSEMALDPADEALIIRASQLISGGLSLPDGRFGHYQHIVVDEVQDLSATELAAILPAVKNPSDVTIVGDVSQRIDVHSTFPGWDRLRRFWDEKESVAQYFSLTVSHRSTLQIMKLADYVQRRSTVGTGRQGRVPIWFHAQKEQLGIRSVIQWLSTALERFPSMLTAVLCRTEADAKFAASMLRPTFGEMVRVAGHGDFSFDAGIIVSDIKQVKGLEFYNVLVWNPSEKNYPKDDPISSNLLYVAITRAQENLCLVTWGKPATALPNRNSPLIRPIDVRSEE